MWQFERAATSISSGSTASFTAHLPTTCREADAGTTVPAQGVATAIAAFGKVCAVGELPIDVRSMVAIVPSLSRCQTAVINAGHGVRVSMPWLTRILPPDARVASWLKQSGSP
jgi:hypothetical protein